MQRRRENKDDTKAVSRSRIDRLCRRRDMPLREKTLWRMLYESASRASAVIALNIEDLDLPPKQAKITTRGGDVMWIIWGTAPPTCCQAQQRGQPIPPAPLTSRKGPTFRSHLEIGLAVAAGIADVGLGMLAAANDLNRCFIPSPGSPTTSR